MFTIVLLISYALVTNEKIIINDRQYPHIFPNKIWAVLKMKDLVRDRKYRMYSNISNITTFKQNECPSSRSYQVTDHIYCVRIE